MELKTDQQTIIEKLKYERMLWHSGVELIAGVDEVGRGPIAGPVVAAAVILRHSFPAELPIRLDDSKKLSENQRNQAYKWIISHAIAYGVGFVEASEIDRINIRQAAMLAMRKAVANMPVPPQHLLIDGLAIEKPPFPQTAIIRGDQHSLSVAAASIVAKVVRDQVMIDYHQKFSVYNFSQNKGYPTAAHLDAIIEHGWSPIHRRSFRPKRLQALGLC